MASAERVTQTEEGLESVDSSCLATRPVMAVLRGPVHTQHETMPSVSAGLPCSAASKCPALAVKCSAARPSASVASLERGKSTGEVLERIRASQTHQVALLSLLTLLLSYLLPTLSRVDKRAGGVGEGRGKSGGREEEVCHLPERWRRKAKRGGAEGKLSLHRDLPRHSSGGRAAPCPSPAFRAGASSMLLRFRPTCVGASFAMGAGNQTDLCANSG